MLISQFLKDLHPRKPADRVEKVRKISRGSKHFAKLKAKHNYVKRKKFRSHTNKSTTHECHFLIVIRKYA